MDTTSSTDPAAPVAVASTTQCRSSRATDTYSVWVGLVYIFNLMVGTGALALPAALDEAGWLLGSVTLLVLAAVSLLAATLVLETQAACAALRTRDHSQINTSSAHNQHIKKEEEDDEEEECEPCGADGAGEGEQPLVRRSSWTPHYTLDERIELSEMARRLLSSRGRVLFYVMLCLYLYGDLSIYSAAIATSLKDVICTYRPNGTDWANATRLADSEPCWGKEAAAAAGGKGMTRGLCYRTVLLLTTLILAPFAACDLRHTKYLQLITSLCRWLALGAMVSAACARLVSEGAQGAPAAASVRGLPALFGTSVYAFMWHHSVPGLVAPMRTKRHLSRLLLADYSLVVLAYLLLCLTAVFAFPALDPLYSLDFVPADDSSPLRFALYYLLALFPVLTLSASYPVVAVTLRRNLTVLSGCEGRRGAAWCMAAAAVAPPLLLTLVVEDVGLLISVTGALAGVGVQYVVPAGLALAARARLRAAGADPARNPHAGPLSHRAGPRLLQAWAALCVALVGLHLLRTHFS